MSRERKGHIRISSFGNMIGISGDDVVLIPISQLQDFRNHPFRVTDDEAMDKLMDSIREQGILVPITVRKLEEEKYEIISGHRRKHAAELAGLIEIPAIIKRLDDDEAVIAMVDSNLQREEILPSEKAFSYRMKLEALKRQGKRTDLTSVQIERKLEAREIVAEEAGESVSQIQRYLRLTELLPKLLEMTDRKELGFSVAVEISYLKQEEQKALLEEMEKADVRPTPVQIERLKKLSQEGGCSADAIHAVLGEVPAKPRKFVMKSKKISEYFSDETTQEEIEQIIFSLLDQWRTAKGNGETA